MNIEPCPFCGGGEMSTLDRLKELSQQATPGPWEVNLDGAEEWWYSDTILGEGGAGGALASCTKGNAPLVVTAINALPDLIEVAEAAKLYLMACDNLHDADSGSKAEWIAGYWADEKEKALRDALAKLTEEV